MAFLELKGVGKGYGRKGDRSEVLAGIDLAVERGEFVAIVGYSGAGKTTLVSMMAGLSSPDSGTITLDGKPMTGPGADRGVVFQNYSLLPWMTAYENIYLAVDQTFARLDAGQEARTHREVPRDGQPDAGAQQEAGGAVGRHAPARLGRARAGDGPGGAAAWTSRWARWTR